MAELKGRISNPISLNAGCELFIAFVTLFPHEHQVFAVLPSCYVIYDLRHSQSFTELKTELVKQGQAYAAEALTYRDKIAQLAFGFIKDDSVVRFSQPDSLAWLWPIAIELL